MTHEEEMKATDEMRKKSPDEMAKVLLKDYDGEFERVEFSYTINEHVNVPLPLIELGDEEAIIEWIKTNYHERLGYSEDIHLLSY